MGRPLRAAGETKTNEVKGLVLGTAKLTPPAKGGIAVAIPISKNLNVIDFSGPWALSKA
ncbi:MAG: hypothetical protein ACR2HH_10830 [Chthoniobacterales bacterium]